MGFSRPEYWSGQPIPSPGDLPNQGIRPGSLALQAESLPWKRPQPPVYISYHKLGPELAGFLISASSIFNMAGLNSLKF